jgi:hypothetical protein
MSTSMYFGFQSTVCAPIHTCMIVRTWPLFNCHFKIHCRCIEQINKASRGDFTPEELKERQV